MAIDNKSKKNTIFSLIKSISAIVFPLITFPYSSRILGVANYGKLNFASSIVTYFALIASLGITTFAIRECGKVKHDKKELGKLASKFFSINLLSTCVSYIALFLCLIIFSTLKEYFWLICIYAFAIIFNTLGAEWLNMAVGDFGYITVRGLISNILAIVLMFIFVHKESDFIIYAIITVTATSGANIVNIFHRRKYCSVVPTANMELKKYLPPILLMFSIIVVQEIFVSSDRTIIGILLDDTAVGLYGAANRIYTLPSALTNSLTNVLLPVLALSFSTNDQEKIKSTQKYGINFLSLLGFPCAAGLIFFSKELIVFVAGETFAPASVSLSVLGIAYFITLFGIVVTNFNLISSGKDKICFVACLVSALANIGLNFLLIPYFGIVAAAWTTAFSHFLVLLIEIPFIDKKIFDISFIKVMIKPFICTVLLICWLFVIKLLFSNIYLVIFFGVLIGAFLYFSFNLLLKEEMTLDFYKKIVSKLKVILMK